MLAAAAVAVAAWPWRQAYHVHNFTVALVIAALAPVTIAYVIAGWRRQPAAVSYGASLAGALILLSVLLGPDFSGVAEGISRGPSRLLTDTLPLTGPYWVVVVPLVLTWLSGAVAGELLIRERNPGPGLAVILAAFVLSVAGASAAPGNPLWMGAALVALVAGVALIRQSPWAAANPAPGERGDVRLGTRRLVAGSACAAVVAAGLWAVIPSLPGLQAGASTVTRQPAISMTLVVSPLDAIAELRDGDANAPPSTLFQLTTDHPASGYLALAALDDYDGGSWTFDRTYLPTGGRIPAPPLGNPAAAGSPLEQRYTIAAGFPASLPFIPFVDHPVSVSGLPVDADAVSGTIVPVSEPEVGQSYSVLSEAPVATLSQVPADAKISAADGAEGIELPAVVAGDLAPTLTYLASLTGEQPTPTVAFLQSMVAALDRTDKRLIPTGTENRGTSLSEVVTAVSVEHAATPEQYATLVAAVARSLGIPARVVTGFRLVSRTGVGIPAGHFAVTNRQAWTWVEVPVAGLGWVVVDPTPRATTTSPISPEKAAQATVTTTTTPAQNALPPASGITRALAPPVVIRVPRHSHLSSWWIVLFVVGGVLVAIGAVFVAFAAWRGGRRRRRRRADPAASAAGAWLEVLDAIARAGAEPGTATTSNEVVELVGRSFGPDLSEPARRVAVLADRALFSEHAVPDAAAARAGWETAIVFGHQLRGRLSRYQRLRGALRLGGRHQQR